MTVSRPSLAALRQSIAAIGRDGGVVAVTAPGERVNLGHRSVDEALGGGLMRGALHDVMPKGAQDGAAATGFALGLITRLTRERDWVWIRQDIAGWESGEPYGPGLAAFGLDPARLLLVMTRDAREALRATEEALQCGALGAVLCEPWGDPKALDLTATRRLTLAAEQSGVTLVILRSGGHGPLGSARTRWDIAGAPSDATPCSGLGHPLFTVHLALNRQPGAGRSGGPWTMEWNHERRLFNPSALSRNRVSKAGDRSVASPRIGFERMSDTIRRVG